MNQPIRPILTLVLMLWCLAPINADTDRTLFGTPDVQAVEYAPQRHIDPMELLPIEINGRWGFADRQGNIIIVPRYDWVDYFYGPVYFGNSKKKRLHFWCARYMVDGKTGNLTFYEADARGQIHMKAEVLEVSNPGGGRDRFYGNFSIIDRWFNNQKRAQLVRPDILGGDTILFDQVLRMIDGNAAVYNGELCGDVDKGGKIVIPMQFAEARSFHENLAAVRLPASHRSAWGFIGQSGKFHLIDEAGEIQELRSYHEGLAAVKARGKWGFMDKSQNVRIMPAYDEVRDFVDGLSAVRRDREWGYINITGDVVAWGFDGAWDFDITSRSGLENTTDRKLTTSLGLIKQGGSFGYVDRNGQIAIEPRYGNALPFFRGIARVSCGGSFAYINQDGRPVWDPRRVSLYGIRGLPLHEPVVPLWTGLPRPDGTHGEPYPFEYNIDDHLPHPTNSPSGQQAQDTNQSQPTDANQPANPSTNQPVDKALQRGSNR